MNPQQVTLLPPWTRVWPWDWTSSSDVDPFYEKSQCQNHKVVPGPSTLPLQGKASTWQAKYSHRLPAHAIRRHIDMLNISPPPFCQVMHSQHTLYDVSAKQKERAASIYDVTYCAATAQSMRRSAKPLFVNNVFFLCVCQYYWLYPVWLCMWQIIKNLEPW